MRKILAPALLATVVVLGAWLLLTAPAQASTPAQQASQPVVILSLIHISEPTRPY